MTYLFIFPLVKKIGRAFVSKILFLRGPLALVNKT